MPSQTRITDSGRGIASTAGALSGLASRVRQGIIQAWTSQLGARIRWGIVKACAWSIVAGVALTLTSWHQGVTPW